MDTENLSAFALLFDGKDGVVNGFFGLCHGITADGTKPACCPVAGKLLTQGSQFIGVCVIQVDAKGTMGVGIDESGDDITPFGVDRIECLVILTAHFRDDASLYGEACLDKGAILV